MQPLSRVILRTCGGSVPTLAALGDSVGGTLERWVGEGSPLAAAAWLSRGAGRWRTRAAAGEGCARGSAEAPDGLAWDLLPRQAPGTLARLGGAELRARPALLSRGVREAVLAVGESGERALWLEARVPAALEPAGARAALQALEGLERAAGDAAELVRGAELERRARLALGTRHDLRNQLALALLELERLELEPARGLEPLRSALGQARQMAQEPLAAASGGAPDRAAPRSGPGEAALRPLLAEELRAAAGLAGGPAAGLLLRCPRELATRAPELELRRLVRNAVLNALRASPAGGHVTVAAGARRGLGPAIVVRDEGRGMAAEEVQRLFRAGESGSGGSGFGTASLLECARACGAEVVVETELGRGTTVRVELLR